MITKKMMFVVTMNHGDDDAVDDIGDGDLTMRMYLVFLVFCHPDLSFFFFSFLSSYTGGLLAHSHHADVHTDS